MLKNKYNMKFDIIDYELYLIQLKNKIYKLLPLREENAEWQKYLNSLLEEVSGLNDILFNRVLLMTIMAKLEGLYKIEDFMLYRRIIFECLSLIDNWRAKGGAMDEEF